MKICEGCIKQDTCKFKKKVEAYEVNPQRVALYGDYIESLEYAVSCKYKQDGHCDVIIPDPWPNLGPYPWGTTTDTPVQFTYTS